MMQEAVVTILFRKPHRKGLKSPVKDLLSTTAPLLRGRGGGMGRGRERGRGEGRGGGRGKGRGGGRGEGRGGERGGGTVRGRGGTVRGEVIVQLQEKCQ